MKKTLLTLAVAAFLASCGTKQTTTVADYEKLADSTVKVLNDVSQIEDYNKIAVAWTEGCNKLEEAAKIEQLATEDSTRMATAKDKVAAKFLEVQAVITSHMLPQAETVTTPTVR